MTYLAFFLFLTALFDRNTILAQSLTRSCGPGSFLGNSGCQLCPPGTFQDSSTASECLPCPAGYFNNLHGAQTIEVCDPCPEDTFSSRGSTSCTPCEMGTFAQAGSDRCLSCPAGTALTRCPDRNGFFSFGILTESIGECVITDGRVVLTQRPVRLQCAPCSSDLVSGPNAKSCESCPANMVAEGMPARCVPKLSCQDGFRPVDEVCTACDNFLFANQTSDPISCVHCPDGFRGNRRRGASRCVPCPNGTFGESGRCRRCPPGQNSAAQGATVCRPDFTECASNFFMNSFGVCQRCTRAQRYNPRLRECQECGDNEESRGGLDTVCRRCPPGSEPRNDFFFLQFADFSNAARCMCKEGFQRMPNGRCSPCPPGFKRSNAIPAIEFSGDFLQQLLCVPCRRGEFTRRRGTISCSACPPGTASTTPGQTRCKRCPRGTRPQTVPSLFTGAACVNPLTNRGEDMLPERKICESNTVNFRMFLLDRCDCVSTTQSREMVNGQCRFCPPGTIGTFGVEGCSSCPAGTFQSEQGRMECDNCPAGMFSRPGARRCRSCPRGTTTFGLGEANCVRPGGLGLGGRSSE